jgi:hypothetical protein
VPAYWLLGAFPSTRDGARRLGMVTLSQMIRALVWAVDTCGAESRILDVPDIRARGGARAAEPGLGEKTTA